MIVSSPLSTKWRKRFLTLADHVATWSQDPSTQVGAVVVDQRKRVVGVGFNGFPDRIADRREWLEDRETKLTLTIHAEVNAILNATASVEGCSLFISMPPCADCAKLVVQAGILYVYYREGRADFMNRWGKSVAQAASVFAKAGMAVVIEARDDASA